MVAKRACPKCGEVICTLPWTDEMFPCRKCGTPLGPELNTETDVKQVCYICERELQEGENDICKTCAEEVGKSAAARIAHDEKYWWRTAPWNWDPDDHPIAFWGSSIAASILGVGILALLLIWLSGGL